MDSSSHRRMVGTFIDLLVYYKKNRPFWCIASLNVPLTKHMDKISSSLVELKEVMLRRDT